MGTLEDIGFSDWFKCRTDDSLTATHNIARVTSVHKDSFTLTKGDKDIFAEASGKLLYSTESPLDLPTTGDWVYADFYDDDSHAIVHSVLPRKTLLQRKAAGRATETQLIAANVDSTFIIQSLNENLNMRRLERYLAMVIEGGIHPIVLLSKSDLMSGEEIRRAKEIVQQTARDTVVIDYSSNTEANIVAIVALLKETQTYCLLGSSGVGKTTLLNRIVGEDSFQTQNVSKVQNKGKHTTTSRQLIRLANGAMIVDTPGMRELGNLSLDSGLEETFEEIAVLSQKCKFGNCSHTKEEGCAILSAIQSGLLPEQRYLSYLKLKKESEFNQMSYSEKRKKDKNFGKMVKSVLSQKGRPKQ